MEIKPIKTESDYREVLNEIETLMMAEADTPEGERLDILVTLVEAYERKHYALDLPDPSKALSFLLVPNLQIGNPSLGSSNFLNDKPKYK